MKRIVTIIILIIGTIPLYAQEQAAPFMLLKVYEAHEVTKEEERISREFRPFVWIDNENLKIFYMDGYIDTFKFSTERLRDYINNLCIWQHLIHTKEIGDMLLSVVETEDDHNKRLLALHYENGSIVYLTCNVLYNNYY